MRWEVMFGVAKIGLIATLAYGNIDASGRIDDLEARVRDLAERVEAAAGEGEWRIYRAEAGLPKREAGAGALPPAAGSCARTGRVEYCQTVQIGEGGAEPDVATP